MHRARQQSPQKQSFFSHPSTFMASCSQNPKLTQMRTYKNLDLIKERTETKTNIFFSFCLNGERVKRKKP